jgi:hypothetical protein
VINDGPLVTRRSRRAWPPTAQTAAAIAAATVIVACGSSSPSAPSSGGQTNPSQAQAQQAVLNFARCTRSHGLSNFPDDLNLQNAAGINPSSPAFKTVQTACQPPLPTTTSPSATTSTHTYTKLLRLSFCLRAHGYPSMPDPRPDPAPSHSSQYDTLYGEGDYWIGIPKSIDAHGAAFVRTARACHATGVG